jgi:hypothetical protein
MQNKIKKYIIVSSPDECPYQITSFPFTCWEKLNEGGEIQECSEKNCPLKNVPDKRTTDINEINVQQYLCNIGYNQCIDEILKG